MKMLGKIRHAVFKFSPFSLKQKKVLTWWLPNSPVKDKDGIIADGSIRSGKTISMSLSFVMWAMESFNYQNFGMCGKTIGSFRRNVLFLLKLMLRARRYKVQDLRADNLLVVRKKGKENYFYIFGGKDERSQDLIQGITLAGVFFDEVALMPESFVNQATGRCSVEGSKFWFNCNPDGPYHWFKVNWIDKVKIKNFIYLHFTMDDNLSLSQKIKARYRGMYTGVFFKRYILGLWVMAAGIIYPNFSEENHCIDEKDLPEAFDRFYITSDYGITNPQVFLKCGFKFIEGTLHLYIIDEYYNKGDGGKLKTDTLFFNDYKKLVSDIREEACIIDPSATSLINLFRQNGINVKAANNEVIPGINNVSTWLNQGRIHIVKAKCPNLIKEFASYIWDEKAQRLGEDKPIKENDHALDSLRYLINTVYPVRGGIGPLNINV